MPSCSGTSTSGLHNSPSSEEGLQQQLIMVEKKRKRRISNRESAKRSRMRKQKHMEDLSEQVNHLRKENSLMITTVNITIQQYMRVDAENSVLRAQVYELSHRLQSLNDMISFLNGGTAEEEETCNVTDSVEAFINSNNNSRNYLYVSQPIIASADMFQY